MYGNQAWRFAGSRPGDAADDVGSAASPGEPAQPCHLLGHMETLVQFRTNRDRRYDRHPGWSPEEFVAARSAERLTSHGKSRGRMPEAAVIAKELFTIYTRLAFGATMILAVLCVVLEQIGGTL